MKIDVFQTTLTRYSSLEIIDYPRMGPPKRVSVIEVELTPCFPGDVLVVMGHVEVTNDLPYAVEVCRRVSIEGGVGGNSGALISPEAGENVSPQTWKREVFPGQHHMLIPFSGVHVMQSETDRIYVAVVMYAGGSSMTKPNEFLKVEQSTNHLDVLRFREG